MLYATIFPTPATPLLLALSGCLLALAGLARAVRDAVAHGSSRLAQRGAWWRLDSWQLKYKNSDPAQGARFPGATTVLVFLTDSWHFFGFATWACADAAFLLAGWPAMGWWALLPVALRRVAFEPFYSFLRKPL